MLTDEQWSGTEMQDAELRGRSLLHSLAERQGLQGATAARATAVGMSVETNRGEVHMVFDERARFGDSSDYRH